jgi:uncharacterized protein (DUF302 family)
MTVRACKHIDLLVVTFDSRSDFESTRARFDERVPLLDPAVSANLVISQPAWSQVQAAITPAIGPSGFLAVSRLDQGALMSLRGPAVHATQYLVGNPLIATEVITGAPEGSLFAPFQAAVYADQRGVHVSYMLPSSLFNSLDDDGVAAIGDRLDAKIEATVAEVCELPRSDAQEDMTAEDDPGREHESEAEAPAPVAETPTRLQQAASGMAEAQAWKGQQIARGWRRLVNALRRREKRGGYVRPASWSPSITERSASERQDWPEQLVQPTSSSRSR